MNNPNTQDYEEAFSIIHELIGLLDISDIFPGACVQKNSPVIGTAWSKKTENGRDYIKVRLDNLRTAAGKVLYAKAWSRKDEPGVFDIYADERDFPLVDVSEFTGLPETTKGKA